MASHGCSVEEAKEKIRLLLNRDKVKLWLSPYTTEGGEKGECTNELITKFSNELGLPMDVVSMTIEELRKHSLYRLAADKKFRQTGVATVKVRFAGHYPDGLKSSSSAPELSVETTLNVRSSDLKKRLAADTGVSAECIKLISSGAVLRDDETLEHQFVKHNSHVMALCLSTNEADQLCQQERAERVSKARKAAELISSREENGDDQYMQITNQSGQALKLPAEERKALMLAMVLHEKGRSALKRRDYGEALVFLLEADGEFKKCSDGILNSVDNYALVCLDIVWCYLCLKNMSSLPDAEMRLKTCEDCFNKSYGPNLERLVTVKGNTGEERALLLRLHLLQGVLAYHQRRNDDARRLFKQAEQELKMLTTNEDDMAHVMEMGFTELEARLALRACAGNVQNAVARIISKREEKKQQRERDKQEKRQKRIEKKLGKTADGQIVNVEHYDSLVSMGFGKGAAAEALRQSNNDITLSYQILHEQPELLNLPDPDPPHFEITDEMLTHLTSMGFDREMAHAALHHFSADVMLAVDDLVRRSGVVPHEWVQALLASSSSSNSTATSVSQLQQREQLEYERELVEEILPDIPKNEDDYLDLTLNDEAGVLCEYMTYLSAL